MDDNFIKYGGRAGAIIAFLMILMLIGFLLCIKYIYDPVRLLDSILIMIHTLWIPTLVLVVIGYLLGKKAAVLHECELGDG